MSLWSVVWVHFLDEKLFDPVGCLHISFEKKKTACKFLAYAVIFFGFSGLAVAGNS